MPLIKRYRAAGWLKAGKRYGEWIVRDGASWPLTTRMGELLPSWESDLALLECSKKSPYVPEHIGLLPALRRSPQHKWGCINRRNWYATSGRGPKHRSPIQAQGMLTRDWVLRLRPNKGLIACFGGHELNLYEYAIMLSEFTIPERAWLSMEGFSGSIPEVILTCENKGAYIDMPLPDNAAAVLSPGDDIAPCVKFLKSLPMVKWRHFGDLDPKGLDIAKRLAAQIVRPLSFFVPSFFNEYMDNAYELKQPWDTLDMPASLRLLVEKGKGLSQETFMLDQRLRAEMLTFLGS